MDKSDDARPEVLGKKFSLFAHIVYHLVESPELPHARAIGLRDSLDSHGASGRDPTSPVKDMQGITHIITSTIDFEGYDAAEERMLAVVKPEWVEESLAKRKLANPRSYNPDPRLFFSGLVICCADLPTGDKDAVTGGVLAMGGLYTSALSRPVTHVVALSIDAPACQIAISKSLPSKIVLPHWFDDCLRLGRRIAEGPYLLPNPEVLRLKPYDRIRQASTPGLHASVSAQSSALGQSRMAPSKQREQLAVFQDKALLLSKDLEIASHLRSAIEDIITTSKGRVVEYIDDADVLICQFREGHEYQMASARGKTVGSLAWLYHTITQNVWTSPLRRLLHYPVARNGIPGFKELRISLSNYSGEARMYLENLAKAAGCEFTKTMKTDNTHLVTAHPESEKCDAAREWNVHIVNHLWLEESYAKWELQSVANPRFSHFPPRTNLGEVVGLTPIDKGALEAVFYSKVPTSGAREVPSDTGVVHVDHGADEESAHLKHVQHIVSHRSNRPQSSKPDSNVTPGRPLNRARGKENETPPTTGSREAKAKAATRIHSLAPDIALYEKEKKRIGGHGFGGRPTEDELVQLRPLQKRSARQHERDEQELPQPKRLKSFKEPALMRLLVTGHDKWKENQKLFHRQQEHLRSLGIVLTAEPNDCTHLAAPRILRTPKFICAMSRAPVLLDISFIHDCLEENKLLAFDSYKLRDVEGERLYQMRLSEASERARKNRGNLLRGQLIFVTDDVKGGYETYKAIVEVNGGKCLLYRTRAGPPAPKASSRLGETIEDGKFLYLVSREETPAKLWGRFRQLAKEWDRLPRITKSDWILDMALSQQIRPSREYELPSGT